MKRLSVLFPGQRAVFWGGFFAHPIMNSSMLRGGLSVAPLCLPPTAHQQKSSLHPAFLSSLTGLFLLTSAASSDHLLISSLCRAPAFFRPLSSLAFNWATSFLYFFLFFLCFFFCFPSLQAHSRFPGLNSPWLPTLHCSAQISFPLALSLFYLLFTRLLPSSGFG